MRRELLGVVCWTFPNSLSVFDQTNSLEDIYIKLAGARRILLFGVLVGDFVVAPKPDCRIRLVSLRASWQGAVDSLIGIKSRASASM